MMEQSQSGLLPADEVSESFNHSLWEPHLAASTFELNLLPFFLISSNISQHSFH